MVSHECLGLVVTQETALRTVGLVVFQCGVQGPPTVRDRLTVGRINY